MTTPSPTTSSPTLTFRRRAGAVAVLAAPALFAVAELTAPADGSDPGGDLAVRAAHHGQLLLSIGAGLLASILFIPAFFALMNPVRGRGTVLTHLGGGLGLLGNALSGLALAGVDFVLYEASSPGVDRAGISHFLRHATADPVGAPLLVGHYLFPLGVLLLAIGLHRAHVGPRWATICLGLAPLLAAVLGTLGMAETVVGVVNDPLLVVGAAGLAWWLLRTTDAVWEGAPEGGTPSGSPVPAAAGTRR